MLIIHIYSVRHKGNFLRRSGCTPYSNKFNIYSDLKEWKTNIFDKFPKWLIILLWKFLPLRYNELRNISFNRRTIKQELQNSMKFIAEIKLDYHAFNILLIDIIKVQRKGSKHP